MRIGGSIGAAILLGAFASAAQADQISRVKPDGVVKGFLSTTQQTRVALQGDRIRRMMAPPEGFEVQNDEKTGDVYLIPLPFAGKRKQAATFLITEKGHTIQVRFTPTAKPAEQVMITIDDGAAPVPVQKRTVRNAPYVDELVEFVRFVIRGEQPGGVEVSRGLNIPFLGGDRIEARWTGGKFEADVVLARAGETSRRLDELQFNETGVAAIWISSREIAPGASARVIIVRLRG